MTLDIENMDHLAEGFYYADGESHWSQKDKRPISCKLLFLVPLTREFSLFNPEVPGKIVSVRVPKGLPIYRFRALIIDLETQLTEIYGVAKRINHVLVRDDSSPDWKFTSQMPLYEVSYV
jgi:hypothetical protein